MHGAFLYTSVIMVYSTQAQYGRRVRTSNVLHTATSYFDYLKTQMQWLPCVSCTGMIHRHIHASTTTGVQYRISSPRTGSYVRRCGWYVFLINGSEVFLFCFELNVEFTLVHSAGYNDPVVVNERHVSSPGIRDRIITIRFKP